MFPGLFNDLLPLHLQIKRCTMYTGTLKGANFYQKTLQQNVLNL